jgi:hypothetical protein
MGRKYPSDVAEKRRAKCSDEQAWREEAARSAVACAPPEHFWHFTGAGRSTCTCGQTTAQLTTSDDGWEVRLVDGRSLFRRGGSAVDVGDELAIRTVVTPQQ